MLSFLLLLFCLLSRSATSRQWKECKFLAPPLFSPKFQVLRFLTSSFLQLVDWPTAWGLFTHTLRCWDGSTFLWSLSGLKRPLPNCFLWLVESPLGSSYLELFTLKSMGTPLQHFSQISSSRSSLCLHLALSWSGIGESMPRLGSYFWRFQELLDRLLPLFHCLQRPSFLNSKAPKAVWSDFWTNFYWVHLRTRRVWYWPSRSQHRLKFSILIEQNSRLSGISARECQ